MTPRYQPGQALPPSRHLVFLSVLSASTGGQLEDYLIFNPISRQCFPPLQKKVWKQPELRRGHTRFLSPRRFRLLLRCAAKGQSASCVCFLGSTTEAARKGRLKSTFPPELRRACFAVQSLSLIVPVLPALIVVNHFNGLICPYRYLVFTSSPNNIFKFFKLTLKLTITGLKQFC